MHYIEWCCLLCKKWTIFPVINHSGDYQLVSVVHNGVVHIRYVTLSNQSLKVWHFCKLDFNLYLGDQTQLEVSFWRHIHDLYQCLTARFCKTKVKTLKLRIDKSLVLWKNFVIIITDKDIHLLGLRDWTIWDNGSDRLV